MSPMFAHLVYFFAPEGDSGLAKPVPRFLLHQRI